MKKVLKIVVSLLVAYSAIGQEYKTTVQYWSVEDGLSGRSVHCVTQDDRGLMWIGTDNGLNRFDGHKFTQLKSENNPLSSGKIVGIKKGPDGALWIQRIRSTVIRFDPVKEIILPYESADSTNFEYLELLCPEGQSELIFFRNKTGRIYKLDENNKIVPYGRISILLHQFAKPTSWGTLLVNKKEPVEKLEILETGEILRRFPITFPFATFYDKNGDQLQFSYNQKDEQKKLEDQLFFIEKEGPLKPIQLKKQDKPIVLGDFDLLNAKGFRYRYIEDHKNFRWLLINQNVFFFDKKGNFIKDLTPDLLSFTKVPWISNQVFIDGQNRLWISTGLGLFLIKVKEHPFQQYLTESGYLSIRAIRELPGNRIFAGSYDGSKILDITSKKVLDSIPHFAISLTKAGKDTLWSGQHGHFIKKIRISDLSYESFLVNEEPGFQAQILFYDTLNKKLYLGTTRGLYIKDEKSNAFLLYRKLNGFDELQKREIFYFYQNQEGIWIASSNGIYLLDVKKGITKHFEFPYKEIKHFHEDKAGDFWLATGGGGLIHWNRKTDIKRQYTTEDGLSHNVIYAVYEDKNGRLWLPSNNGLMRFEKTTGEVVVFLPEDGITHEEFNTWSHYQAPDWRLHFGGLNGFIAFYPEDIEITENEAPFIVIQFQQFDSREGRLLYKTQNLLNTRQIILNPGDKFFTIDFSLLDYSARDHTYAWRIKGLDNDWTYQTDNRIRINALEHGDFNLQIKAKGYGGQWAKNELNIPIRVLRPFYLKTWFLILGSLLAALFIGSIFRYRTSQLRRNAEKLSVEVAKRTSTIREQNKQLQQANQFKDTIMSLIAHDLRAPLISLRGLSSKMSFLIKKQRIEDITKLGETIDQSTSNVTELLDNLLNWAMIQKGTMTIRPEQLCLKDLSDETLALYSDIAETKSIQLTGLSESGHYIHADKNSVSTILRNLLHNALKFTPEGGQIEVLNIQKPGKSGFEVRDSGIGIEAEKIESLFDLDRKNRRRGTAGEKGTGIGLLLCKELVDLNQGTIEVKSSLGHGSSFHILFPKP